MTYLQENGSLRSVSGGGGRQPAVVAEAGAAGGSARAAIGRNAVTGKAARPANTVRRFAAIFICPFVYAIGNASRRHPTVLSTAAGRWKRNAGEILRAQF